MREWEIFILVGLLGLAAAAIIEVAARVGAVCH